MKNSIRIFSVLFPVVTLCILIASCKKSNESSSTSSGNFPTVISNMISKGMVDSIRSAGGTVYDGTTPPTVNGIYFMHPDSCIYDNSPAHFANSLFVDYKFNFANQNNTAFTITVAQKEMANGTLSSTPVYSYISGTGNNFSIFIFRNISPSGIQVEQFNVLSGTVANGGIQNFQNTLYVKSKGNDPGNTYAAAGTIRVFVTGKPGLATTSSSF